MSPLTLVVACLLVAGLAYCLWRPQVAIVAIILQFPIEQLIQSYFPIAQRTPWMINAGVAGVAGVALLSRLSQGKPVLMGYKNPVTISVFALYGLAWIGLLWSPGFAHGSAMLTAGLPYAVLSLIIAPMLVAEVEEYRAILGPFLVAGTVVAALIFVNPNLSYYAGRMTLELGMYGPDQRGNPLALADVGAMMAMVAVLYLAPQKTPLLLGLRIAAFILGLRLAIVSGSRGQVLAAIVCGFAFYPLARRVRSFRQFVAAGIGVAILGAAFYIGFRSSIVYENEGRWAAEAMVGGLEDRTARVEKLLRAYARNPIAWPFGLGTNAHSAVVRGDNYVHNFLVEVLCEEGLVGLGVVFAGMYFTFASARSLYRSLGSNLAARATVAVLGAQAGFFFLLSLKQGSFLGGGSTAFMYWLLLGRMARNEEARVAAQEWEQAFEEENAPLPEPEEQVRRPLAAPAYDAGP